MERNVVLNDRAVLAAARVACHWGDGEPAEDWDTMSAYCQSWIQLMEDALIAYFEADANDKSEEPRGD